MSKKHTDQISRIIHMHLRFKEENLFGKCGLDLDPAYSTNTDEVKEYEFSLCFAPHLPPQELAFILSEE